MKKIVIDRFAFWLLVRFSMEKTCEKEQIYNHVVITQRQGRKILTIRLPQYESIIPRVLTGLSIADMPHKEMGKILIAYGIDDELLESLPILKLYTLHEAQVFKCYEIELIIA
jgi:hypothetical protein